MTKAFDPYKTLNVKKTAGEKEIRAAAKAHAKNNHPDAGGDREKFIDGRRALAILTDPKAKEKFDRTGEADPDTVDNTLSLALGIIETELGKLIDGYLKSGFDPQKDPCRVNVVTFVSNEIRKAIAETKNARSNGDRYLAFIRKMSRRFVRKSTDSLAFDFIKKRFEDRVREAEAKFVELEQLIARQELALKIIQSYSFEVEKGSVLMTSSTSTSGFGFTTIIIG